MVSARADGRNNLFWLGGSKDEFDVGRWLFDDLEQGVEAGRGDHVGLIENEDFVAVASRGKSRTFAKVAGVVNTVVAGCVDFDDIHAAATVARKFDTARALAARGVGWAFGAV